MRLDTAILLALSALVMGDFWYNITEFSLQVSGSEDLNVTKYAILHGYR